MLLPVVATVKLGTLEFTIIEILFEVVQIEGDVAVKLITVLLVGAITKEDDVAPVLHE
jgi:hypothetical protein